MRANFTLRQVEFNAQIYAPPEGIWRVNSALCYARKFHAPPGGISRANFTIKFHGAFRPCDLQLPKFCDLIAQRRGLFKLQRCRGFEHLLAELLYDLGALGGRHLL